MQAPPPTMAIGHATAERRCCRGGLLALGSIAMLLTASAPATAQNRILSCRDTNGIAILTDAEKCPSGTTLEQRKVYDLPPKRAVPRESSQSASGAGRSSRATPARSIPTGNSSKANERIAQAQIAACADLQARKAELDSLLQADSDGGEQSSQRFRDKIGRIEADRCRLGCQPC